MSDVLRHKHRPTQSGTYILLASQRTYFPWLALVAKYAEQGLRNCWASVRLSLHSAAARHCSDRVCCRGPGDIHRLLHGPANSSKCEQRHVVSWQRLVLHSEQPGAVPNYLTYKRTIIRPHGIDAAYCYSLTYRGPCVPVSHTQASCAKMTEPIGMPFIGQIRVGSKNQWSRSPEALWGGQVTALWPIKSIERCGVYWVRRCVPLRR